MAAELLDRLATLDLKGRGAVTVLHAEARKGTGRPLSLDAAQSLHDRVGPGDAVVICTGFPVRPWISLTIGETDGPPGAAALARALALGLGAVPILTAPPGMVDQVASTLTASGVLVLPPDQALRAPGASRPTCAAAVIPFPTDPAEADEAALRLLDTFSPAAIAAVEHPGANADGVYRSSVGVDISAGCAKVEALFAGAARRGILTLSFLDMPNEIGAGRLRGALPRLPFGDLHDRPSGGTSEVDIVVVGTTANWAVYATVGMLSVLVGDPALCMTAERDRRAIAAVQGHGGVEGVSGSIDPDAGVDGIPTDASGRVVELIRLVAEDARAALTRRAF